MGQSTRRIQKKVRINQMRNIHQENQMWYGAKALVEFIERLPKGVKKYCRNESAFNSLLRVCLEHWDEVLEQRMVLRYDEKKKMFSYATE